MFIIYSCVCHSYVYVCVSECVREYVQAIGLAVRIAERDTCEEVIQELSGM